MHIFVNLTPGSKKRKIEKSSDNCYDVFIKSLPQNNMANEELIFMLAKHFEISVSCVKIVSGHKKRKKQVVIKK